MTMDRVNNYEIDVNDKTNQAICETYIKMKKEGIYIDSDNLFFRLKKQDIIVEDGDFLYAVIEYLELLNVRGISTYGYCLDDIPQSAYNWKRQKMTPKEFHVFLCKISNIAFYFARKNIVPDISNKYILNWRYQYESFSGYKLNKDKIGYMIKILNEAGLTDIRKSKKQVDGRWSTLHKIVMGQKHPFYYCSILTSDESVKIYKKSQEGIITDYNDNKPKYDLWYSYWLKNRAFWALA